MGTNGCRSTTTTARYEDRLPPADPFYALRYHFGMLLGVEDFEAEQAYHRGKHRLHNAWLHGEGVVWGLGVSAPRPDGAFRGEIQVDPGLALDAAGNELHLDTPHCVDLSEWYEEKKQQGALDEDDERQRADGGVEVEIVAHVIARFRACLMRPVPALMEPCDGQGGDTAYSRAYETMELRLVPGQPDDDVDLPYPRLRLFFGIAAPRLDEGQPIDADAAVLQALDGIRNAPDDDARRQRVLEAFRRFAALDVIDLGPSAADGDAPSARYPRDGRPPVLLAAVKLRLGRGTEESRWALTDAQVTNEVRPAHVATRTIQELLCGIFTRGAAAAAGPAVASPPAEAEDQPGPPPAPQPAPAPAPRPEEDAGGPRVETESVALSGRTISFQPTDPVLTESVTPRGIVAHAFHKRRGWVPVEIEKARYDTRKKRVVARLKEKPAGDLLRVRVRGTGDAPLLGRNLVPLAGVVGGPPGSKHQGNDLTFMLPIRS